MERKVLFVEGEYYHIYNRGVEKRTIFLNTYDYQRFILLLHVLNTSENLKIRDLLRTHSVDELLRTKNKNPLVAIGAYCLMPNHFHLLLTPVVKNGISKFMLKLQTSYAMYFNIKNDRSGALFQGAFKSQHLNTDEYLKYIYSYIHLNPAKLKDKNWIEHGPKNFHSLKEFILSYKHSSIGEYVKSDFLIVNTLAFPEYKKLYKSDKEYFQNMIDDWLNYKEITQGSPVLGI
ncbi:MAG: Transposase [Candidatus Nomurabacteria bacterium GW2011_GWB1_47_6]|uniref:Transposase n=1 Tax=Candidatus Nomurabacteria bacterium GW2011_GWB1_47_6 TaxID=1618749 RepID=A0A0G1T216_9BACT|nr:MAG: Transposase [Candidatus Nomurabacteria bacterium GW2011_GWB1_47_6]